VNKKNNTSEGSIWVKSELLPGGSYNVTLDFTPDDSITLTDEEALQYSLAILEVAHIAEYEASILAQMKAADISETTAARFIADNFRPYRHLPDTGTPLELIPGISQRTKQPFLVIILRGVEVGQWDFKDAREHAQAILDVICVARLDQVYYHSLADRLEMAEPQARTMVSLIGKFRPNGVIL